MVRTVEERLWHLSTAVLVGAALVGQLVLTVMGTTVLIPDYAPSLPVRVWQFFSYFTVQSNIAVCVASVLLVRRRPARASGQTLWHFCALLGISVTGVVYAVALAPLVDFTGVQWWLDKILHVVAPLAALVGWLLFTPRHQFGGRTLVAALTWPVLWLAYTLVVGAARGWYPYPFLDPRPTGATSVVLACLGVTVLFVALGSAVLWLDRRLPQFRAR